MFQQQEYRDRPPIPYYAMLPPYPYYYQHPPYFYPPPYQQLTNYRPLYQRPIEEHHPLYFPDSQQVPDEEEFHRGQHVEGKQLYEPPMTPEQEAALLKIEQRKIESQNKKPKRVRRPKEPYFGAFACVLIRWCLCVMKWALSNSLKPNSMSQFEVFSNRCRSDIQTFTLKFDEIARNKQTPSSDTFNKQHYFALIPLVSFMCPALRYCNSVYGPPQNASLEILNAYHAIAQKTKVLEDKIMLQRQTKGEYGKMSAIADYFVPFARIVSNWFELHNNRLVVVTDISTDDQLLKQLKKQATDELPLHGTICNNDNLLLSHFDVELKRREKQTFTILKRAEWGASPPEDCAVKSPELQAVNNEQLDSQPQWNEQDVPYQPAHDMPYQPAHDEWMQQNSHLQWDRQWNCAPFVDGEVDKPTDAQIQAQLLALFIEKKDDPLKHYRRAQ